MTMTAHPQSLPLLPMSRPSISEAAIADVVEVLRSGWITSGPKVQQFEREFAAATRCAHAVAVSSGTAGLDLILHALRLQPGDEVITPSINWVSGPNLIELNGGTPIFCDVLARTLQCDPASVAQLLSPRTRAIMPVHFAGMPCDLTALRALATQRSIPIIEDAAHAAGALYAGKPIGAGSHAAVFSFHPTKNMTTAEGGMVVVNDQATAELLRLGRFHGIKKDAWKHFGRSGRDRYQVVEPGRKYNLTDIQATLGIHQLRDLPAANARRRELAMRYLTRLSGSPIVETLACEAPGDLHAWHIFVVLVRLERVRGGRDALVGALEARGIGTGLHFPAVHSQQFYAGKYPDVHLTVTDAVSERLLSLPLFPGMADQDVDRVADALAELSVELAP
jgi:UDP-4-amino-4-deoxy-L-arabinose-oxoglutarate aminotransferase